MTTLGRSADPLVLLRESTVAKKKVHWSDDHLEFESCRIHRNTKCGFRLSPKDPLIDIGSVWYMLHEVSADRSYTKDSAKKRGFKYIGVASRGDLCDYLVGQKSYCNGLISDVIEGRKRPQEDAADGETRSKLAKTSGKAPDRATVGGTAVPVQEISSADVIARVRPVKDLDVLVRCPGRTVPNADLILRIAQDEWKHWHRRAEHKGGDQLVGKIPLIVEIEEELRRNQDNVPIILVPCNKNSPVNLLNAAELLTDGVYKKPDEERVRFFESTRPEFVEVLRNINGRMWKFQVRDSAKNFTKAQWLRTVCVVTDGSDWQFKGWPFETIVDLFSTVKGIYFQAPGVPTPLHVHQWAVDQLPLSPAQMDHRFAQVRDAFFMRLEDFLKSYRLKKFVNHTTLEGGKRIVLKPKPVL